MELVESGCSERQCFEWIETYIENQQRGKAPLPFCPQLSLFSLQKMGQLALLWEQAGCVEEARLLAQALLPLQKFPTLWTREKEFSRDALEQTFVSLSHLYCPSLPPSLLPFDLTVWETPFFSAALTLDGRKTSLGIFSSSQKEQVLAFGPQDRALEFGISGKGMQGWVATAPFPELWLECKADIEPQALQLKIRFVGLQPSMPLNWAFYIKAASCRVREQIFYPKTLRRYHHEGNRVDFEKGLFLQSSIPYRLQVVPLAGQDCFWGSDFLILFEWPPFIQQMSFIIGNHFENI